MTSKIYKTFKRSISTSKNDFASSGQGTSSSSSGGSKYAGGSGKTWIHPPDVLLNGRVEYSVKLLGEKEVQQAKGTDTIRDAIHAIRFQLQVKRGETGHSGAKLQKVDLHINVDGITVVDTKTKMVLHRYPLQRISFCADDKQDKRVFSFIAKGEGAGGAERHDCMVFLSDKMAEQITLTVGEAFDLAYKRYMDKNKQSLETQKQLLVLKKRIAELESENQVLSERLAEAISGGGKEKKEEQSTDALLEQLLAPAIPSTPIPAAPPQSLSAPAGSVPAFIAPPLPPLTVQAGSSNGPILYANQNLFGLSNSPIAPAVPSRPSPSGPAPAFPAPTLAPPPAVAPRRAVGSTSSTSPIGQAEVGRRLENLNLHQMEDVFDDAFDPRATEKKKPEENGKYDPFGDDFLCSVLASGTAAGEATADKMEADRLQHMINECDRRLADFSSGFCLGELETGDTGDAAADMERSSPNGEGDYGTPNNALAPGVSGSKKE